jgi:condensin complex subunit 2
MKKRLQEKRRVSGAALLREELNNRDAGNTSLLDDLPMVQQDKGVMMANFEEWIKMATDNKINSTNSWNFALIDYFHDLNVLRGHDNNINFQKASATLDGCVKIYSSRVDSVATETGRLLSGLATKKNREVEQNEGAEDEDDENDEENDDDEGDDDNNGGKVKKPSRTKKITEFGDTLATFESLKIKKLSLELVIDPLFKKTLAEFDEGGAKSLLLNTLNMDKQARVVFDASTTNANDDESSSRFGKDLGEIEEEDEDVETSIIKDQDIAVSGLKSFLYTADEDLESATLCPSFDHLTSVLQDINKAKSLLNDVNEKNQTFEFKQSDVPLDMNDNDFYELDLGGNDDSYGELENEAAAVIFEDELKEDEEEVEGNETGVIASVVDQDLMAYFDNTLKRNWAGPEHWRVRQLKKVKQHDLQLSEDTQKNKKKKEPFTIDFLTGLTEDGEAAQEKKIFTKGKASATLPEEEWQSKDSYLLPDDLYFSSEQLTRLFTKPQQKLNIFRRRVNIQTKELAQHDDENREVDATFWAENYEQNEQEKNGEDPFFDEDGGGNDFDDGFDDFGPSDSTPVNFGTQLIKGNAKIKSEALNYSKTAKNVNVKALKDNIWNVLDNKKVVEIAGGTDEALTDTDTDTKQFSSVVKDIANIYPREQKKDLSTSFFFICLLHLANEHSLVLENNESLTDLAIHGLNSST